MTTTAVDQSAAVEFDIGFEGPNEVRGTMLVEASAAAGARKVVLDLIVEGFGNRADNHYYSGSLLEKIASKFVGSDMYSDHLTEAAERALGGMPRSWRDKVGRIDKTWIALNEAGRKVIRGEARIFDDQLANLLERAMDVVGVSINARGVSRPGQAEGRSAKIVDDIVKVKSVDVVSEAGAGGRFAEILEAARQDEENSPMRRKATDDDVPAVDATLSGDDAPGTVPGDRVPPALRNRKVREAETEENAAKSTDEFEDELDGDIAAAEEDDQAPSEADGPDEGGEQAPGEDGDDAVTEADEDEDEDPELVAADDDGDEGDDDADGGDDGAGDAGEDGDAVTEASMAEYSTGGRTTAPGFKLHRGTGPGGSGTSGASSWGPEWAGFMDYSTDITQGDSIERQRVATPNGDFILEHEGGEAAAALSKLLEADGGPELLARNLRNMVAAKLREAVSVAVASVKDELAEQAGAAVREAEQRHAEDLAQVEQRYAAGALIEAAALPVGSQRRLKAEFHDAYFADSSKRSGMERLTEAVSNAIDDKLEELGAFTGAPRVSGVGRTSTGLKESGRGTVSPQPRDDRPEDTTDQQIDRELDS